LEYKITSYDSVVINGTLFRTEPSEEHLKTMNCGIKAKFNGAEGIAWYYGKIQMLVDVEPYKGAEPWKMAKVLWLDDLDKKFDNLPDHQLRRVDVPAVSTSKQNDIWIALKSIHPSNVLFWDRTYGCAEREDGQYNVIERGRRFGL
jgi:hypothetical protein